MSVDKTIRPFRNKVSSRKKTLKRDNNECYICHSTDKLHIHHIIPRRRGGTEGADNLVTLCSGCHKSIEAGNLENAVFKCVNRAINQVSGKTTIQKPKQQKSGYPKENCKNCGEIFDKTRYWKMFCSSYCKYDHFDKTHPRTKIN